MYAPGCASLDEARLTEEQAQEQRAAASFQAVSSQATSQVLSQESRVPPRSQSPAYNSSDDDTLDGPEHMWSQTKGVYRRNKAWVKKLAESALALPAPEPVKPPYAERVAVLRCPSAPGTKAPKKTMPAPPPTEDKSANRSRAVAEPSTLVPAVGISKQVIKETAAPSETSDSEGLASVTREIEGGGFPKSARR
jgi:hypothetical protein